MLEEQKNDTLEGLAAATEAFARSVRQSQGSLDWLPIGVCVCDRKGRVTRFNSNAATLWGYTPVIGEEIFAIERDLRAANNRGVFLNADDCPMGIALRTGEPVRDSEITLKRPDGVTVVVLATVDPLFDEQGRLVGAVKCFQDITQKKESEQRLRQGARQIRDLIDALPAAIYTTDAAGRLSFFNKSAVELWGRTPVLNEDLWCGSYKLYTADGAPLPLDQCPMARALKEGVPIRDVEAIVERPDGSRIPCLPYPTPFHDISGALLGGINMMVDITERKKADERQKVMIDELNHRVKNTLATVHAMATQSFRGAETSADGVTAFMARLLALSATHDQLTNAQWQSADLSGLLKNVLKPMLDCANERVRLDGPSLPLAPRAALTIGLALNELATNAMKYGALSTPEGALDISWRREGADLALYWRERGGPPVAPPTRRGFGTRMIERGITAELDGSADLRFVPLGFECDLRMPLASLA